MTMYYVIPCSGAKLQQVAPARDLYQGTMFHHTLTAAEQTAAADRAELGLQTRILVLSAKHGLIDLDEPVAPYDCRMGDAESVSVEQLTEQAQLLGMDWESDEVWCLLPNAYLERLDAALRVLDVYAHDVYEANRGVGDQRNINCQISK
jgi:hypothetical protein